ncbi:hypothetical protein DE146DRAFT_309833 [Phaeosphaeria sp. MPI-PUGE-AT-0046c]|nr:hypothetical protein DE146DRAFT_309833 [Phaeosphaeria sp. MPI-PUGE-AT-0046c]
MGFIISSWAIITAACIVASIAYFTSILYEERRFYRDNDLPQAPGHHWLFGHLKLTEETLHALLMASHYQTTVTKIALKYNMPGVLYLYLWPAGRGQSIVTNQTSRNSSQSPIITRSAQ